MNKHVWWLWEQLEAWTNRGVISREQADQIRTLYPKPKAAPPWGTIIFSGLGAVILGLGIVLLFAYNWNVLPKAAKLALIFFALVGAHAGGLWLWRRPGWHRPLGEALCVLGTMFFGAGIWLVAQMYHIDEHFPNGFLIWGLGALAMAWVLPSPAHGLLAVVVLCIWNCTEAWDFQMPVHWGPILLLLGPGALAWGQRSRTVLCVTLAGFGLAVIANVSALQAGLLIPVVMSLAAGFIGVRVLVPRHTGFPEAAPVWGFFGWLGFLVCAYLLTFHEVVDDLLPWGWRASAEHRFQAFTHVGVSFVLALLAWGAVALPWVKDPNRARGDCPYENWIAPLGATLSLVFWLVELQGSEGQVAGLFNLVCLALAAAWMGRGCREADLACTILGSLLLTALAAGRYFDLFESLALRGLVFVIVGGVLFAEGIFYTRARRRSIREGAV